MHVTDTLLGVFFGGEDHFHKYHENKTLANKRQFTETHVLLL